jgi:hypothetical protein
VRETIIAMAELKVYLSEELNKRFRVLAMSIFGYGRGSLSEAAVEALNSWCKEHESCNENLGRLNVSGPESDPVARAEERPGLLAPAKEKDARSVLLQSKTNETSPPGISDSHGN